jgi:gamma-tubulin complex component 5
MLMQQSGPTLSRVLAQASGFQDAHAMLKPEVMFSFSFLMPARSHSTQRYINEEDMVREVLMALQGNNNIVLMWSDGSFKASSTNRSRTNLLTAPVCRRHPTPQD